MNNKEISIEIVKFSIESGIYSRNITDTIDISEDEESEFWDLVKANKTRIQDILKDADTLQYKGKNRELSQEDKIKIYLGTFKWIVKKQTRTTKAVLIWHRSVRRLNRIYRLNLVKNIEESILDSDKKNQGINKTDDFIGKLMSSQNKER